MRILDKYCEMLLEMEWNRYAIKYRLKMVTRKLYQKYIGKIEILMELEN